MTSHLHFDQPQYARYADARRLGEDALRATAEAVRAFVVPGQGRRLLDLGAGTGRFSTLLQETLGVACVSVEPARQMRSRGAAEAPDVVWVGARAEQLPFRDGSFGYAFLSMVLHHLELEASARELGRVLDERGVVLIRNHFSGRLDSIPLYRWFRAARRVDQVRLPTVEAALAAFDSFAWHRLLTVRQVAAAGLAEYRARLTAPAMSVFDYLDGEEIEQGLRAIDTAVAAAAEPGPVWSDVDLLVIGR